MCVCVCVCACVSVLYLVRSFSDVVLLLVVNCLHIWAYILLMFSLGFVVHVLFLLLLCVITFAFLV